MYKKRLIVGLLLAFVLLSVFVSAQDSSPSGQIISFFQGFADVVTGFFEAIAPLLNVLFGSELVTGLDEGGSLLVKLILFAVVGGVFLVGLKKMPMFDENPSVAWIVSLGIALIGVRYLSSTDYLTALFLPSSTVTAILSIIIPLGGLFIFIENFFEGAKYSTLRKAMWVISGVMFLILYLTLFNEVDYSWAHLISAVACLVFFWFDGTLQKAMVRIQSDKALSETVKEEMAQLREQIRTEAERFRNGDYKGRGGRTAYEKRVKELKDRIATLAST
jgi:hypothetical protein